MIANGMGQDDIIIHHLAHPAACDHANPVSWVKYINP